MRSSATSHVALVGLVAGLASAYGCSPSSSSHNNPFTTGAAGTGTSGTSGAAGMSGSTGASGTGETGGMAGSAQGTAGAAGQGSAGMSGAGGGMAGSTAGAAGQAAAGATGTAGAGSDITKVVMTTGCGKDPMIAVGTAVHGTIPTMGTKEAQCADSNCAPWMYTRDYYVTLPMGYDKTKAYPLVLEGPGCGGGGLDVYPLTFMGASSVNNTVIRVGLTPPPNTIGHATNPGQGCFDDKEGDDSVDWVFYENLYDRLSGQLCFDKNRVFSVGNSSGSWFSNEIGCKYAGDATRPIRGVLPNTGGLPTDPRYVPTCTNKPMAGMWVHEVNDPTNPFTGNNVAIARAMKVNGCTPGASYDDPLTMFDNFPIGGGNQDTVCKKIRGCPELYPLVVCPLPGNAHGSHDNVTNPGFSTFISLFEKAPLLTQ
jgi:poly(3-hydroxybutyrate) depolymerase